MPAILTGLIMVVHIVACIGLMISILLQSGKGGGLAGAFGGIPEPGDDGARGDLLRHVAHARRLLFASGSGEEKPHPGRCAPPRGPGRLAAARRDAGAAAAVTDSGWNARESGIAGSRRSAHERIAGSADGRDAARAGEPGGADARDRRTLRVTTPGWWNLVDTYV